MSLRQRFQNSGDTIPGTPGTDFPDFRSIPITKFSCLDGASQGGTRRPGFYADVETQCQVRTFDTSIGCPKRYTLFILEK